MSAASRFEAEYLAYRRGKRVYAFVFGAAFLVCLIAAGITAKFDVVTLIGGLPRTSEFLVKLVPPISIASFAADMREWYWDIGKWMGSLLNTLLMAWLATVLGTAIGGFLSFFAARNLANCGTATSCGRSSSRSIAHRAARCCPIASSQRALRSSPPSRAT